MKLVVLAALALALAASVATQLANGGPAVPSASSVAARLERVESGLTGICRAFRRYNVTRNIEHYDEDFVGLIRDLKLACGSRTTETEHHSPPAPPPTHH